MGYHNNKKNTIFVRNMMNTMKRAFFIMYGLLTFIFQIQADYTDSLVNIVNTQRHTPTEKLALYDTICTSIQDDLKRTIKHTFDALSFAQKYKDKVRASRYSNIIGGSYDAMAVYDSSLYYFEKALTLGIEAGDNDREASALLNIANSYHRQNKYTLALEYYMKLIPLNEALGVWDRHVATLGNIAEIYVDLKNFSRAEYYIEQADKLANEHGFTHLLLQSYYVRGCISMAKGEYEKALDYQFKSAEISHRIEYTTYESYSMQSIAQIYIRLMDYGNALRYAQECLYLSERLGDPKLCARAWTLLSDIYYKQKQYKECIVAASQAFALDSMSLDIIPGLAYNIALSNMYLGNRKETEIFLEKYSFLKDQYIDTHYRDAMLDMEIKYETEKKEIRINLLEKEKELYIGLGIVCVTALFLALGLFLIWHRLNIQKQKLSRQQIKQLEQEKQLIATQSLLDGETAERSRLSRDLHDGLGGMLSVIKLNLGNMKLNSAKEGMNVEHYNKAMQMLDDSVNELRRVAHHMMPESLMRYGLKVSLEDFCLAIPGASFLYLGEDDQRLDNRLEVVLYRSTYELVNNALKHANAKHINVQLIIDKNVVSLTVSDDGIGFTPETVISGLGLENIRTRVSAYNGKMNIYSSQGNGTEINIEIECID